jgi:hypothetical protein
VWWLVQWYSDQDNSPPSFFTGRTIPLWFYLTHDIQGIFPSCILRDDNCSWWKKNRKHRRRIIPLVNIMRGELSGSGIIWDLFAQYPHNLNNKIIWHFIIRLFYNFINSLNTLKWSTHLPREKNNDEKLLVKQISWAVGIHLKYFVPASRCFHFLIPVTKLTIILISYKHYFSVMLYKNASPLSNFTVSTTKFMYIVHNYMYINQYVHVLAF